jgi:hypothetical protein
MSKSFSNLFPLETFRAVTKSKLFSTFLPLEIFRVGINYLVVNGPSPCGRSTLLILPLLSPFFTHILMLHIITYSYIFTYSHIHIYSHIFTYIHIYSHIFTYIHIYSHIFTYIRTYSHISMHAQLHLVEDLMEHMQDTLRRQQDQAHVDVLLSLSFSPVLSPFFIQTFILPIHMYSHIFTHIHTHSHTFTHIYTHSHTFREQLHLAEDLMERVQDTLRRQQTDQTHAETKDFGKIERELQRIFEEFDQLNMKQVRTKIDRVGEGKRLKKGCAGVCMGTARVPEGVQGLRRIDDGPRESQGSASARRHRG